MPLPSINIIFKTLAATLISRSAKGIVALILNDDTDKTFDTKVYIGGEVVSSSNWTAANKDLIEKCMLGSPSKIIVERLDAAAADDSAAYDRLKNKQFNYIAIPGANATRTAALVAWVKARRDIDHKTYKAVVGDGTNPDHEGIINFTTSGIVVGATTYSATQYTSRIAGILAGLPYSRSSTLYELSEVTAITESSDPDTDIDAGKLILINDVGKIKIARGVNSFVTFTPTKSKVFSKIKIMEGVDLMNEDIRTTFHNSYTGKVVNSYDNKQLFFAAVNAYFAGLEKDLILDDEWENLAELDYESQRTYLAGLGISVDTMTEQQIRTYNTNDQVFGIANVKFLDAMEDLNFNIYM
jgi:hypothetical protein